MDGRGEVRQMRRIRSRLLPLLLLLALCACGGTERADQRVLVCLEEGGPFALEENGLRVLPGWDVRFELHMEPGARVVSTDYRGEYRIWRDGDVTRLDLLNVRFPTRVRVNVTRQFRPVRYSPNGGTGEEVEQVYDLRTRLRPNTLTDDGAFSRPGYTLTGWNTAPDGFGERVGLGSRVTVPQDGLTLYAQWVAWSPERDFTYEAGEGGATVTGYAGTDARVVVPERLGGLPVTAIANGAFADAAVEAVILPKTLARVEDGAFARCALKTLLLSDNIETISDAAFAGCGGLRTLYINAAEPPYGYLYRRESVYADKVDLLIEAQGRKKLVFYGGCSMWYNLNGQTVQYAVGKDYTVINMGLNGTVTSNVQMAIIEAFLEDGDIFFHAPELSSPQQLLTFRDMRDRYDNQLWCGLENNYDLFALVDLRGIGGVFDSLCGYLGTKTRAADYQQSYTDSQGRGYMDGTGSIPFLRAESTGSLVDKVYLDPEKVASADLGPLLEYYRRYAEKGARVYVSHACVDLDAVPEDQRGNVAAVEEAFRGQMARTKDAVLVSSLWDFLYHDEDFYDTVYHMCTAAADRNTAIWLRDLRAQMQADGLWPEG